MSRVDAYANALYEVAKAEGALSAVEDEIFRFARTMDGNDELRSALTNQALPAERRQAVVEELLGSRAHPVTTALVSFVVGAGRARELPDIAQQLVTRAASERQREVAEVRSAVELNDDQRQRLEAALSKATGKQVTVKVVIDPTVMGGLVSTIGDVVLDGSVRHRIDQMRSQFT